MSTRSVKPSNTSMSVAPTTKVAGSSTSGVVVKKNSNAVEVWADGACWDVVANAFVLPEDTTVKDPK